MIKRCKRGVQLFIGTGTETTSRLVEMVFGKRTVKTSTSNAYKGNAEKGNADMSLLVLTTRRMRQG